MTIDYTQTQNYGLDKYGDKSPADLRDGHNRNMDVIDGALKLNADNINLKANSKDVYTKEQTDGLLEPKADKTYVDNKDKGLSDRIDGKADTGVSYTKSESDALYTTPSTVDGKIDGKLTGYYTKQESDVKFEPLHVLTKHVLVTIGDSYGSATPPASWCVKLAESMGMELKNFCIGGKGFLSPSGSYLDQITNAANDGSFSNDIVDYVVVAGSRNDLDSSGILHNAASNVAKAALQLFPYAKIVCVPMLWDWKPMDAYWRTNASDVLSGFQDVLADSSLTFKDKSRIILVPWAWTWNLGATWNFTGTDIHPDEAGSQRIASYIHQAINGNYHGRFVSTSIKAPGNTGLWSMNIVGQGGTITYSFALNEGATPADVTDFTIPIWAGSNSDYSNGGRGWTMMAANGANDSVLFKVNPVSTTDLNQSPRVSAGIQGYTAATKATPGALLGGTFTCAW